MHCHLARTILASLVLVALTPAQSLDLDLQAGSFPGSIEWRLSGGVPLGQSGVILMSTTAGPIPLSIFNPLDPRVLRVGTDLLDVSPVGFFDGSGAMAPPPLPVPNLPSLRDFALYFQGLSFPGSVSVIDRISEPRAPRFAPANSFRDRLLAMFTGRSFFPVIDAGDGKYLMLGGGAGALFAQIATNTTEIYDPISDSYANGPTMAFPRSLHTATRLQDGRWLIVAGVNMQNDPQNTCEIWNPATGQFSTAPSLVLQRAAHSATLLADGRVLVAGGMTDLNAPNSPLDPIFSTTRTTEIYNPTTNTWSAGPNLRKPRVGQVPISRADGKVLLCGGASFTLIFPSVESTTDLFDPANNSIVAGPAMRNGRGLPTVVSVGPGRWLLAGGIGSLLNLGAPTATAEIYDAGTNAFTSTGSMAQARALHGAQPIGNGRILHFGGADGALFAANPLASAEIYTIATGQFTPAPSMNFDRAAPGHHLLPTGQIHVIGGDNSAVGVMVSSEFYFR